MHYAKTLRHWRRRFAANRDTMAALYDDRFCRMFEFYLAVAEIGFRRRHQVVFHLQFAHRQTAVPLTRDYMIDTGGQFWQTERPLLPANGRANSNASRRISRLHSGGYIGKLQRVECRPGRRPERSSAAAHAAARQKAERLAFLCRLGSNLTLRRRKRGMGRRDGLCLRLLGLLCFSIAPFLTLGHYFLLHFKRPAAAAIAPKARHGPPSVGHIPPRSAAESLATPPLGRIQRNAPRTEVSAASTAQDIRARLNIPVTAGRTSRRALVHPLAAIRGP